MLLAHTAQASGPHTEYLVLAGAFLVLGIVLFVQKTVKPVVSLAIVLLAVALGSGAFFLGGSSSPAATGVSVVVIEPKPGDPVPAGKEFPLEINVSGAQLASSDTASDGGHIHVYVDGQNISMTSSLEPRVKLKEGEHTIMVELVDAKHLPYTPEVRDTIQVVAKS